MGAPFPIDSLVPLRDGNDFNRPTRFARSVPQLGSEFVFLPFITLWGMIQVHIINSEMLGNVISHPFISRDLPRDSNTQRDEKGDSPRALLYLPRRDNVAISHHINVSPSFCNLLQPMQALVNKCSSTTPHPSLTVEVPPHSYC